MATRIKLTTNKALQAGNMAGLAQQVAHVLAQCERTAPVTLDSHGVMIAMMLSHLSEAQTLATQFLDMVARRDEAIALAPESNSES